jgi:hypothetical protein
VDDPSTCSTRACGMPSRCAASLSEAVI